MLSHANKIWPLGHYRSRQSNSICATRPERREQVPPPVVRKIVPALPTTQRSAPDQEREIAQVEDAVAAISPLAAHTVASRNASARVRRTTRAAPVIAPGIRTRR